MSIGGITPTGFQTPTLQDVESDLETKIRSKLGPSVDMSSDQPLGQITGVISAKHSDLWNKLEDLYNTVDPNAAEGVPLDNVASLTGTKRPNPTFTTVTAQIVLNAITLSAGALASVEGRPDLVFALRDNATTSTTATSTASVWVCLTAGAIDVQANTLTVITTPITGWVSINNADAGATGTDATSDTQLRALRSEELQATGSCNAGALDGQLDKMVGMLSAVVYENKTDLAVTVSGVGGSFVRPPHTFEAVIWDGSSPAVENNDIAAVLLANKPAGISPCGTTSGTATDDLGNVQTMPFTRATKERLYVVITATLDPTVAYAGDAAVKAALASYINATQLKPGTELVALPFRAASLVAGVLDAPVFEFGLSPSPTNTANMPLSYDEILTLATGDITLTTV